MTTQLADRPPTATATEKQRRFRVNGLAELGPIVAFAALLVLFAIIAPSFFGLFNLTNVVRQVSITAIAGVGMTLIILVRGIDLSVGSLVALAGSLAALSLSGDPSGHTAGGAILAVILAVAVGAAVGAVNGMLVTVAVVPAFIATLATMTAVRGLALLITDSSPVSIPDGPYLQIGLGDVFGVPIPVIIMALVFGLGYLVLHRMKIGRRIYAVGGNPEAARLAGIRVNGVLMFVYVFGGVCMAISAIILSSRLSSGQPAGSVGLELDVIAAVVVGGTSLFGGRGRLAGTFFGALLIGSLVNGLQLLNVPDYWQRIVTGGVIVAAVVLDRIVRRNRTTS
jgi:ribose transport system permease protein